MNFPNMLCYARIILIPVFIFFMDAQNQRIAAYIFAILALTDLFDGYMARRYKEVTTIGKFLDPLADKLLVAAALLYLMHMGRAPVWMVYIIIARELTITGFRAIAASKKQVIAASKLGKIKTALQITAVLWLILDFPLGWHVLLIATAMSIISGLDYFVKNRKVLKD